MPIFLITALALLVTSLSTLASDTNNSLFNKSFSDLADIKIKDKSLLSTSLQEDAIALTIIDQDDINNSSARNLNELLEIYVPGLKIYTQDGTSNHISLRGNMSTHDMHVMMMINGHRINARNFSGGSMGRDIHLIDDIHKVEVIRGAISSTYGTGVMSGAINIITKADYESGNAVKLLKGVVDNNLSAEITSAKTHNNGGSHYFYIGLSDVNGASTKNSPLRISRDFDIYDNPLRPYTAHSNFSTDIPAYKANLNGQLDIKANGQYNYGPLTIWFNHERNSESNAHRWFLFDDTSISDFRDFGFNVHDLNASKLQASSIGLSYVNEINSKSNISLKYSVDETQRYGHLLFSLPTFESELAGNSIDFQPRLFHTTSKERRHSLSSSFNYKHNNSHQSSLTTEFSYEKYGLDSDLDDEVDESLYFHPTTGSIDRALRFVEGGASTPWSIKRGSAIAEHAYKPNERLSLLGSIAYSWHSDVESTWLPSLRAVYDASESTTIFASFASAVRTPAESEIRANIIERKTETAQDEKVKNYEIGFRKKIGETASLEARTYFNKTELTHIIEPNQGSIGNGLRSSFNIPVGTQKDYGLEIEYSNKRDDLSYGISYAYQKLKSLDLSIDPTSFRQYVSSSAYGFGDDLTFSPLHTLKAHARYAINNKIKVHGSLAAHLKFEGYKNYLEYLSSIYSRRIEPLDTSVHSDPIIKLNLGANYQMNEAFKISLNAYDLMGLVDKKYNRTTTSRRLTQYRINPAAISLSAKYSF